MSLHVLLLAAGESKRYGGIKALSTWRGRSLLDYSCRELMALGALTVVLGAHAEQLGSHVPQAAHMVINDEWAQGQATSLVCGMRALPSTASAVLIALMDQPLLTSFHYQQLHNRWLLHPDQICASFYAGHRGVPAIFPAAYFSALDQLQGDRGAKSLLNDTAVQTLDLPEAAFDVDRPDDWHRIDHHQL